MSDTKLHRPGPATVSLRVSAHLWMSEARCDELLRCLGGRSREIGELAFFTSSTHSPLPFAAIAERARMLRETMPRFKALGLRVGINHLATMGHLDENLENSLSEPWQRVTDIDGTIAKGSYCPLDSRFQGYVRDSYRALAEARPEFIWIDDDVRMAHHPPVQSSCFCPLCLRRFAEETGESWTRERAAREIHGEGRAASLETRARWVAHNRRILDELFALIRGAVDEVDPDLVLGFMPIGHLYEGMGFDQWGMTLAGGRGLPVKWRPGGGLYNDAQPASLLVKAHSMGRMAAAIPRTDVDIQYELESFPYQKLKKSETVFVVETGAALAAGCTGVALNLMGISPDPFDEYLPYFDRMREARPLLDRLVALAGRSPCEGLWPAMAADIWAAGVGPASADPLPRLTEPAEIGLPPAYSRAGARVNLLCGDAVRSFRRDELEGLLAEAAMVDGPALLRLQEMDLASLAGFEVAGSRDHDTIERFTDDPLNAPHAGWWRDCRPSFWQADAYLLRPLGPHARTLAMLIDFAGRVSAPVMGAFENRLGGRVVVMGYSPWDWLQSLAKSTQMKSLCRWLSRDRIPAYVSSFHKVALWSRRDARGSLVIPLINASLDTVSAVRLHAAESRPLRLMRLDGREEDLQTVARDGVYSVVELPVLGPWEMVLVAGTPDRP